MKGTKKELLELASERHIPYKRLEAYRNERRPRLLIIMSTLLVVTAAMLILFLMLHCQSMYIYVVYVPTNNTSSEVPSPTEALPSEMSANPGMAAGQADIVRTLGNLDFLNYGVVSSTDKYVWNKIPCNYLEAQNVTGPYMGWADTQSCNYLYKAVGDDLMAPPPGMRSSIPLGGIGAGNIELRADGSFHEWSIFNQHPAGAAKIQVMDDVFMGVRAVSADGNKEFAMVLQTHPNNPQLPSTRKLSYQGSYPVSKLSVMDARLPVEATVYAYSSYSLNNMSLSAIPAIAFTAVFNNTRDNNYTASFMFNLPIGIEPHTQRSAEQMSAPIDMSQNQDSQSETEVKTGVSSALDCFHNCSGKASCSSWSYNEAGSECTLYSDVRLNGHKDGSSSGIKGSWSSNNECITLNRVATYTSAGGNMSLCPFSSDPKATLSFGVNDDIVELWKTFSDSGGFSGKNAGSFVSGAAAISVELGPREAKEVTIVLGWFFPNRDFVGIPIGNYYSNLVSNSEAAAQLLGSNLGITVSNISTLHKPFFDSSLPDYLKDMLINSLSHVRSAFWLKDGRWRQWEAYDCTNIDSVHNDGERHIPYIKIFPQSTINKMYAWAEFQQSNGMIQEQLRCGCTGLPLSPQKVEFGCGRTMSDVSSMFITYLLELYKWGHSEHLDMTKVLNDLWPSAKRAAQWHMDISANDSLPKHLVSTYDIVGITAYPFATYNSAFHLLAMRAAEELAYIMNDTEFAHTCHTYYENGQLAMDRYLWNETAEYYNAYTPYDFDSDAFYEATGVAVCGYPLPDIDSENLTYHHGPQRLMSAEECVEGRPDTPGAIMADSFYAQVLAYSLGLGTLVQNETRLRLHMKAELENNDTPYGLLVMTGRFPYPGPSGSDNAVWMMANPNWASIALHLGIEPDLALDVAEKTLDHWRQVVHDQWNVAGLTGGLDYGDDGNSYVTSHYGYFMSSWHLVFALTGQNYNASTRTLHFSPKLKPPFKLPFILPGVWGSIESQLVEKPTSQVEMSSTTALYTLTLNYGYLNLDHVSVANCPNAESNKNLTPLTAGAFSTWTCPQVNH